MLRTIIIVGAGTYCRGLSGELVKGGYKMLNSVVLIGGVKQKVDDIFILISNNLSTCW